MIKMADFITLVIGYLIFCIFCFGVYVYWEESWLQKSIFVSILRAMWKMSWRIMPRFIRSSLFSLLGIFVYQRNHLFQVLYAASVALGHVVLVLDALPVLYHYAWNENHVFLPLLFAFSNGLLYAGTMLSDPGVMTEKTCFKYAEVYCPDRVLYKPNNRCTTCNLIKPARSKHCAICDHCVHRFDHHCVWTNCCIGGMNYRYFIGFLLSLVAMCANAAMMGIKTLVWQVAASRLWEAQWLDDEGIPQPMTHRVLIQHLFMQYPRLVLLIATMIPLAVALIGYSFYHFYLIAKNQTTNERYKWCRLRALQLDGGRKMKFDSYNQGLRRNLSEVLQPYRYLSKDKIYRSKWR